MPSNTTLNTGSGGDIIATKERTHDGDAAKVQVVTLAGVTGTEGSYTYGDINGDATNGLDVDVTRLPALPAGTNNIGDVDILSIAAGDNNIGNVDVVTLPALPAGTNNIGDVDVLTLPALPAGTNNIGDVDVLSVVPGTGATSLGKAEDAAHTTGDTGVMALVVRRDADTALVGTDGDYAPLQVNAAGSLKVAITSGAGSGGTSIADGASFTRDTTSITPAGAVVETSAPTLTNGDVAGLSMTTAGALRVNVASGGIAGVVEDAAAAGGEEGVLLLAVRRDAASSGVSADGDFAALSVTSDGSLRVSGSSGTTQFAEDAAHTTGDSGVVMLAVRRDTAAVGSGTDGDYSTINVNASGRVYTSATVDAALPAGTNNIGDVDVLTLPALPAGTNNIGDVDVLSIAAGTNLIGNVGIGVRTSGGTTIFRSIDIDETEEEIKGTAGQVYWIHATNIRTTPVYLKFYNETAANVTVGTTTPVLTFLVPSQGTANGAGFFLNVPAGIAFGTAITVAATTGVADNDTGAPGANECVVNVGYA